MRKLLVLFILIFGGKVFAQNDFDALSTKTFKYKDLCYPVQAGKSFTIPITVKCNITKKFQPYTVSIDIPSSFYEYYSWVTVDKASQNVDSSQTVTFNLTITPPATPYITPDGKYPFTLSFTVYNKDNTHIYPTFTKPTFKVIVDNSAPVKPTISPSSKTSRSITISGCSSFDPGYLSSDYSLANDTAGVYGMRGLTHILKKSSDNSIVQNATLAYKNTRDFYTFSNVSPNTAYIAIVTATDLAGNSNPSTGLSITTPPAPPASGTFTNTYCSATLTWPNSSGATGYYIYDAARNLITPTPIGANSYTKTGLSAGTSCSFYVAAVSSAGGTSELSTLFTTTIPTVPRPTVAGPTITCSLYSSLTFSVTNLPSGCSVSWGCNSNLSLSSAAGNSATFTTIANGPGKVTAVYSSCGGSGSLQAASVWVGFPLMPVVDGEHTIPCGGGELYTEDSRMQVQWSISSPFRIVGGSSGSKCNIQAPPESAIAWLYATAANACGTNRGEFQIQVSCDSYSVFPNPASSEITIAPLSKKAIASEDKKDKLIKSVRVVDRFGSTLYFQKYSSETVESKVSISNFPIGVYVITINEGSDAESHTIVKQ